MIGHANNRFDSNITCVFVTYDIPCEVAAFVRKMPISLYLYIKTGMYKRNNEEYGLVTGKGRTLQIPAEKHTYSTDVMPLRCDARYMMRLTPA
jgi:hypothetical protein